MLVLCMYVQPEMVKCQFFFRFFPQQQFDRQFSFRVEVLNHMGWYLGHKGLLAPTPPSQVIPSNQLISAQMESTCFKGILTCALFLKSRDFRDIKLHQGKVPKKKRGKKLTTTGNMGQHIVFLFLRFCTFFKIFHVRLGKKTKNVSFYRRVCMCKGKTNICQFFFSIFFFEPFPKQVW